MKRPTDYVGLVAGALIALSSIPHSALGWPAIRAQLLSAAVSPDLVTGLMAGWQFGGAAMLACGLLTVLLFRARLAGQQPPLSPAWCVGLMFAGFGGWALVVSGGSLFFLVFLVPGLLVTLAAWGAGR